MTFRVGDLDLSEEDVCNAIATEISSFMRQDIPGVINTVMEEWIAAMDEQLWDIRGDWEVGRFKDHMVTFKEFDFCGDPHLLRSRETIISMLRTKIREHVRVSSHKTLSGLLEAARERDMELDTQQWKRVKGQVHASTLTSMKS